MQPTCCFGNEGRPTESIGSTREQQDSLVLISAHFSWQGRAWSMTDLCGIISLKQGRVSAPTSFFFSVFFFKWKPGCLESGCTCDAEMWQWVSINSELFFVAVSSIYLYRQKVKPVLCITIEYGIVRKIFFVVVLLWNYPCHPIT